MRILVMFLTLFSIAYAAELDTTDVMSKKLMKADMEATKSSEENIKKEEESRKISGAERRNIEVSGKHTEFKVKPFVATGIFLVGAITGYLGYDANEDAKYYHKEYETETDVERIEVLKQEISDSESRRNTFYIISGASLISVTVTLTLF